MRQISVSGQLDLRTRLGRGANVGLNLIDRTIGIDNDNPIGAALSLGKKAGTQALPEIVSALFHAVKAHVGYDRGLQQALYRVKTSGWAQRW